MSQFIFQYLNNDNVLWVDILNIKYGRLNFWYHTPPPKCSWFFRGLCKSAMFIKHHCKLHSVNPNNNFLMWDPWLFNIPLALKPTFINMDMELSISTFLILLLMITGTSKTWTPYSVITLLASTFLCQLLSIILIHTRSGIPNLTIMESLQQFIITLIVLTLSRMVGLVGSLFGKFLLLPRWKTLFGFVLKVGCPLMLSYPTLTLAG